MAKFTAQNDLKSVDPDDVQRLVGSILDLNRMGRCRTNKELQDRIDQYFMFCQTHKLRPGIESLCMALHITRQTLFRWKNGIDCDAERTELIQQAIVVIHAFLEQLGMQQKINPATFIFLAKNWLNYRDTHSIEEMTPIKSDAKFNYNDVAKKLGIEELLETESLQIGDDNYDDL